MLKKIGTTVFLSLLIFCPGLFAGQDDQSLMGRLVSSNFVVRQGGMRDLEGLKQEDKNKFIPELVDFFRKGDAGQRVGAGNALSAIGAPAIPSLLQAMTVKDAEQTKLVLRVLGNMGPGAMEALPAIINQLKKSGDNNVRYEAVVALGKMGQEASETVPLLIDILENDEIWVRRAAATALGQMSDKALAALPMLCNALKPEEPLALRLCAVKAIGSFGFKADKAASRLSHILFSEDDPLELKDAAFAALKNIGTEDALASAEHYRKKTIKEAPMPQPMKKVLLEESEE